MQLREELDTLSAANAEHDAVLREAWRARQDATGVRDVTQDAPVLDQRAQDARQRWADAATQFVDGRIDGDEYARLRDAAQAEFEAASVAIAAQRHAEAPPALAEVLGAAATWGPALAGDDIFVQRTILARLVERVVPVHLGHARYSARIGWTVLGETLRSCAAVLPVRTTPLVRAHPGVVLFRSGTMPQVTLSATSRRHRTRNLDQLRALPQPAFDALPERDRALVELYCGRTDGEPHSWEDLGKRFGLGRCRVGQILRRSMVHLLGVGSAPKTWAVLVCATCGTQFARSSWDVRAQRAYACSGYCARALRSRLQRAHSRPHAEQLRALDPAAFDSLPEREREVLTRYYGVAGQRGTAWPSCLAVSAPPTRAC